MAEEGAFSMAMVHGHFPPIEKAVARLAVSSYRQEADRMLLASFQRNNSEKRRRFCWQQKKSHTGMIDWWKSHQTFSRPKINVMTMIKDLFVASRHPKECVIARIRIHVLPIFVVTAKNMIC